MKSFIVNKAERLAVLSIAVCVIIQVALAVVYWDAPMHNDASSYIALAQGCVDRGHWYPDMVNVHDMYLFAPGMVNLLVLLIKVFGTFKAIIPLNIVMNLGLTGLLYYIGKVFFQRKTACVAVALWSLLYSTWFIVVAPFTELPFTFLCVGVLALVVHAAKKSASPWQNAFLYLASGALLIIANYIRPLAALFLAVVILYMILHKVRRINYICLILPCLAGAYLLGQISLRNTGIFAFQSSTSGVNLIMTACDEAYGGVCIDPLYKPGSYAYIDHANELTFVEKDSIWRTRAINYIKEHPTRYTYLFFNKMARLWLEDSWADRALFPVGGIADQLAASKTWGEKMLCLGGILMKNLVYYITCFFCLRFVFRKWRCLIADYKQLSILALLLIFGTALTCLFSVSSRYHYPFMFIVVLFAAAEVLNIKVGNNQDE